MADRKLTEKQKRWAHAYVGPARGNAGEAARLAGYEGSPETLRRSGHDNTTNPAVVAYVAELNDKIGKTGKKAVLKGRQVMEILSAIALGDPELTKDELVTTQSGDVVIDPRKVGDPDPFYHPPVKVSDRRAAAMDIAKILRLFGEDQTPQVALYFFNSLLPQLDLPIEVKEQVLASLGRAQLNAVNK